MTREEYKNKIEDYSKNMLKYEKEEIELNLSMIDIEFDSKKLIDATNAKYEIIMNEYKKRDLK